MQLPSSVVSQVDINDDVHSSDVNHDASTSLGASGSSESISAASTASSINVHSNMSLPTYSDRVMSQIATKNISPELNRMVEETAYHILKHGDLSTRDEYDAYGRRLYDLYPCIGFPGNEPWVNY